MPDDVARDSGLINSDYLVSQLRDFYANAQSGQIEQMQLEARGFTVQSWTMPGGVTALFATLPHQENAPAILFYNHFAGLSAKEAKVTDEAGRLGGPGIMAAGSFVARLEALDKWREKAGEAGLNVKWLIEGEAGKINPDLAGMVREHAEELKADGCLWATGEYASDGRAVVNLGSKGILTVELGSHTMSHDADAALAGVLPNAAWRLVWALNALKGESEDIRISGFGDESDSDLSIPNADIKLLMSSVRDHKTRLANRLKDFGIEAYLMELRDPQVLLTEFFTPTANISSFQAGTDKTGLPAQARARIDFRLVPNHTPDKVLDLLKTHLAAKGFEDVTIEPVDLPLKPAYTSHTEIFAKIVIEAASEGAEIAPLIIPLSPGAEPIAFFKEALSDLPVIGLGVADEYFSLDADTESISEAAFVAHSQIVTRILEKMAASTELNLPEPEPLSFTDSTDITDTEVN